MEEVIFEDYGIEIIRRDGKLFIRYDAGELVTQMIDAEISETESTKAQRSPQDAYEVILVTQKRDGAL